jgi:hypothetical protein
MEHPLAAGVFVIGLSAGILVLLVVGRWIGARRLAKDPEGARAGLGAVEAAIFGLMGLLFAFSFSGAAGRFDIRRNLILEEANAIGTAWLRLDMLPTDDQRLLRETFRRYLDSRLAAYRKLRLDIRAGEEEVARATAIQGEIWTQAVAACRAPGGQPAIMLVLPALNQMFDIAAARAMAARTHPPTVILIMLGVLPLASALLAGYAMAGGKAPSWIHMLVFALILAGTVYVILDLEFPRRGLIQVEAADQILMKLRETMK